MPTTTPSRYAVILAGGSGQRFWPTSRDGLPKQLLKLFGEKTLLELTVERLTGLLPKENILILTNVQQEAAVRELMTDLPPENIVAEPAKRDTGPAIALGIGWVAARDSEATMMVLPADHLINDVTGFQRVLERSMDAAESEAALVTVGITPTWACPSYGYVERAEPLTNALRSDGPAVFNVKCFREKPAPELAEHFLAQGNFAWNAGMFIWSLPVVMRELASHTPELVTFIESLSRSTDFAATVADRFPTLQKLSIDYALMEKATRVLNVESQFDWDDVGNWTSVARYLDQLEDGNQVRAAFSQHAASNNIVFSETPQHIALLGVDDLIVVTAKDAVLVASKAHAETIKKLVDRLPAALR
jgi:mannose-1-phosphate guanylyltransferase